MTYGDVILQYRLDHGLSQRAFAAKSGLSNSYIAFLENNRNPTTGKEIRPTIETLAQLAKAMDIDINKFISMVDDDSRVVINSNIQADNEQAYIRVRYPETKVLAAGFEEMPPETRAMLMGMFNAAYAKVKAEQNKERNYDK